MSANKTELSLLQVLGQTGADIVRIEGLPGDGKRLDWVILHKRVEGKIWLLFYEIRREATTTSYSLFNVTPFEQTKLY